MALGIDIYRRYQTVDNWSQVKNAGVTFCYVKLTDGNAVASAGPGDNEINGAKSVGIPAGGYHFSQPGDAAAQARLFVNEVKRTGALGLALQLDLEDNPPESGKANIPDSQKKAWGIAFCNEVMRLGFRPGVYMNNALAKLLRPDQWGINGLVIWIARYGAKPAPEAGRYDIHQYTSSGTILGIRASGVDLNESYTSNHFGSQGASMATVHERQTAETRAQLTGSETPNNYPGFQSLVPGSTYHATVTDYVLQIDFRTYKMEQNTLPALLNGFNAFGAQLSVVFTTINDKLDAIIDQTDGLSQPAGIASVSEAVDKLKQVCGEIPSTPAYVENPEPEQENQS
jgi:GH25 family lysozyme M1 (1,4-beta-N-acetylmuramidase)